ncbi:RNA polymerase II assembly factor like protein [Tanacetum coccineum]|uniref:RNA polymerase II assembly factor like protein n=1 Tax=Tanacetum coccineum TaxID=301880 RepID=A0ABQ5IQJ7_9ASTR
MIDDAPCGLIDKVIKDLTFEPKINAMMRDFLNSPWWEKLSKETGSEILPSGDRSRQASPQILENPEVVGLFHQIGVRGMHIHFAPTGWCQIVEVSISDTEMKTIKLLSTIIHTYNTSSDNSKDQYRKLLIEILGIISSMKHLYTSDGMGRCKPNLAAFVAGLGHIQFEETDNNSKVSASWELFHMLLKERHWALAHLAMTAFGYFSALTSCNELWRFVPPDAALSFDLESGVDVNDERFMSEFKVFFEKEVANVKTTPGSNELALHVKEGLLLKQMAHKMMTIDSDAMEIDDTTQTNKKRKFPDGIGEGVSLLQNGLRIIASGLLMASMAANSDAVGQMAATISQTK